MRIKKAMKETFYVTSGKSCRGAAFDFCYNSFMGLITFQLLIFRYYGRYGKNYFNKS